MCGLNTRYLAAHLAVRIVLGVGDPDPRVIPDQNVDLRAVSRASGRARVGVAERSERGCFVDEEGVRGEAAHRRACAARSRVSALLALSNLSSRGATFSVVFGDEAHHLEPIEEGRLPGEGLVGIS